VRLQPLPTHLELKNRLYNALQIDECNGVSADDRNLGGKPASWAGLGAIGNAVFADFDWMQSVNLILVLNH
jgi:hypothetical protein